MKYVLVTGERPGGGQGRGGGAQLRGGSLDGLPARC